MTAQILMKLPVASAPFMSRGDVESWAVGWLQKEISAGASLADALARLQAAAPIMAHFVEGQWASLDALHVLADERSGRVGQPG